MIKVNLLASNPGVPVPREWLPREQRSAFGGIGIMLVTFLFVGGFWYYQHSQRTTLDTKVAAAETELLRLKDAAQLVERTAARKAELSERLGLIERLRVSKRAPVSLLETVSASVPEGLWLLEIKQTAAVVQVDGRATSITAVTDFTARLQTSGYFLHPVEIVSTSTEAIDDVPIVRFVVKAETAPPAPSADALVAVPSGNAALNAPRAGV